MRGCSRPRSVRAPSTPELCRAGARLARSATPRGRLSRAAATLADRPDTSTTRHMDALSELLRAVKLSGAMFYLAECSKPWRVISPPASTLGRYVAPDASHVIEFHLVLQGSATSASATETTPFAAGDLLMVPHGDEHEMGNGVGGPLYDAEPGMASCSRAACCARASAAAARRRGCVCGYLACDAGLIRPVLAGLPRVVRVHLRNDRGRRVARAVDPARRRARAGGGAGQRRDPRPARRGAVHRSAAALRDAAAGRAHRLAGRRRRRDRRPQPGRAAPSARASVDARRAGPGGRRVAIGADRALRPLSRREPDGVPHRLASRARRRGAAHVEPQRAAGRGRGRLRIGGGVQPRLQAEVRQPAGAIPARARARQRSRRPETAPAWRLRRRPAPRRRPPARSRPGCARRRRCRWSGPAA